MFLKRIELSGFKSFADKTELEFVQGITAVVGPNGSGKSNISDGIRWVLGEQSARSLRGGKMEDIIFAGSDARKAVNFGEVSLTLDNTDQALPLDFSEVTVTRRVHRSGDSEYFINKQSCRLKDITELFMDTGIGKEAYSIIGQGRIEEILSTKSEERRGIFEEASGIVKYKSRKKEAEKKLEDTEQNLLRIHDLVSELEDQIEPLREQSEKAHRYKQLKEELKSGEISMYVHQIEQIHESWTSANVRLEELRRQQLTLATVVNRHDAQLETHRSESRRLEEQLEQLNQLLLKISEESEKCEGQGEVLKERKRHLALNASQLEQTIEGQAARNEEKGAELASLEQLLAKTQTELDGILIRLKAEEEKLVGVAGGLSSGEEERLKSVMLDLLNAMAQSRNEIRYAEQQIETLTRRLERMSDEEAKWSAGREKTLERKESLEREIRQAAEEIQQVRARFLAAGEDLQAKQKLNDETQQMVRKWEQRLDALVSRRDTMKEMQNDYDGFIHGVKEVLKAKDRPDGLRGIHGAVAELVSVPAEVEIAVETALGGALQHVVVGSEAEGRAAIAFLKRRQLGRATFLPLDVIRGRFLPENDRRTAEAADGFVGIAMDLVRFDERYRNIFSSLLGNVIIAASLEQANHIAARCQYRYRIVTLEGDVVNPGGSMTGGSQHKKTTSLLGRQRQIEELDQEIGTSTEQLSRLKEKAAELKAGLGKGTAQLEQLRQLGEQKRIGEQQLRAELAPLNQELSHLQDQLTVLSQDRLALQQEIKENERKIVSCEAELGRQREEEALLQQQIRDAETRRKSNESAKEELQSQLTDLKVQAASTDQVKQSLVDQRKRQQSELSAALRELEQNRETLNSVKMEQSVNEEELTRQIEQSNDLQLRKRECAEQIDFKRAERSEWLNKLQLEENETKEQRVELKQVEVELHQTEVRVNRLDVELDNLLKKLAEEYELSFELAKERYPVPEDIAGTQSKVRELKREISSLGEVNLGAIEEFARISERYEFLSEQKSDLMDAKAALYGVIREMDDEMSKRFRQTFDAIRSQFVVVFAKLFGGGRADLILSEPDNLLYTGIEIVAQPPGKKLQNLQLLSGGERALTAIALLFAILRIKPVPFCVLDEVEAALDEANVARFAEYLREFSQQTQFIVVTHRKGTMEEADVLYGVTMEEGGVSKLVSVRLDDDAELASA